ncbi:hypothetical protein PL75_11035, partial [Neisseria arctica]
VSGTPIEPASSGFKHPLPTLLGGKGGGFVLGLGGGVVSEGGGAGRVVGRAVGGGLGGVF